MPASRPIVLSVLNGADSGRSLRAEGERVLVGRADECDLQLRSGQISRSHLAIGWDGDVWRIVEVGALNATLLDAEVAAVGQALRHGQVLRLADIQVLVQMPADEGLGRAAERWRLLRNGAGAVLVLALVLGVAARLDPPPADRIPDAAYAGIELRRELLPPAEGAITAGRLWREASIAPAVDGCPGAEGIERYEELLGLLRILPPDAQPVSPATVRERLDQAEAACLRQAVLYRELESPTDEGSETSRSR